MNERGEWTSKHHVSQRDVTEELGITRTAIHYRVPEPFNYELSKYSLKRVGWHS